MWTVETLNEAVDDEIDALPVDMRARFARYVGLIEQFGLQSLPAEATKHLENKIWELRISGTAVQQRVVILRVFVKKTQKTPAKELKLARLRAKEVK